MGAPFSWFWRHGKTTKTSQSCGGSAGFQPRESEVLNNPAFRPGFSQRTPQVRGLDSGIWEGPPQMGAPRPASWDLGKHGLGNGNPPSRLRHRMHRGATMLDTVKSAHHRDFYITQNGWFTILRPARKFAAARASGIPRPLVGQPDAAPVHATGPALALLGTDVDHHSGRSLWRASLIVGSAALITLSLLLWICRP